MGLHHPVGRHPRRLCHHSVSLERPMSKLTKKEFEIVKSALNVAIDDVWDEMWDEMRWIGGDNPLSDELVRLREEKRVLHKALRVLEESVEEETS